MDNGRLPVVFRPSSIVSGVVMVEADVLAYERAWWAAGCVVAGLDEAGRGAWAGPVVAGAAIT